MFKSQTRPILFTQFDHGRPAGTAAQAWGNEDFDRPALDFPAFVAGVTLHDWGYGILDNLPIGEVTDEDWLQIVRNGVEKRFDHPTTDIVVKLHIRRLLSMYSSPERTAWIKRIDELVDGRLPEAGAPLAEFQRADKITQLCDMISFSFCFDTAVQRTYEVFNRQDSSETTSITFKIKPVGEIIVAPWPFSVPVIFGVTYAFESAGYPGALNPLVVPYYIQSN